MSAARPPGAATTVKAVCSTQRLFGKLVWSKQLLCPRWADAEARVWSSHQPPVAPLTSVSLLCMQVTTICGGTPFLSAYPKRPILPFSRETYRYRTRVQMNLETKELRDIETQENQHVMGKANHLKRTQPEGMVYM